MDCKVSKVFKVFKELLVLRETKVYKVQEEIKVY